MQIGIRGISVHPLVLEVHPSMHVVIGSTSTHAHWN